MMEREVILSVKDLNVKFSLRGQVLHAIRGISLDLYKGESLAIVGESGSGKSVFTKNFIGLLDKNGWVDSGEIIYKGNVIKPTVRKSVANGFGLIPEDRRTQGFSPLLSVTRNVSLTNYDKLAKGGFVKKTDEDDLGVKAVRSHILRDVPRHSLWRSRRRPTSFPDRRETPWTHSHPTSFAKYRYVPPPL